MHHSSKFISSTHIKYLFTRKLAVFDTNGGSSPYRVAMIHETDTILQQGVAVLIQYEYFSVRYHIHRHIRL